MGQYYNVIILDSNNKVIRAWMCAHSYNYGVKMVEHCSASSEFVAAVESQICPEGAFYRSAIVWAGDYADVEVGAVPLGTAAAAAAANLHSMIDMHPHSKKGICPAVRDMDAYPYIINWSKRLYVDKTREPMIHPLPILTAEGNGRGGGDYHGTSMDLVGTWARDELSVEAAIPEGFALLKCGFNLENEI